MKVITLTLSPAFDVHCRAETFIAAHENQAVITARDAGGKGLNISRALTAGGIPNTALVVLGDENGDEFRALMQSYGVNAVPLTVPGRIRENITVHPADAPETRLSFPGFSVDDSLLERVEETVLWEAEQGDILTLTGRLPDGLSMPAVKRMLSRLTGKGLKLVLDSNSFSWDDLRDCRPFLIKPNQEEISAYLGRPISDFAQLTEETKELRDAGVENVIVSLGDKGAMLTDAAGTMIAEPPKIKAVSTVGAGDSFIAGFLSGVIRNEPKEEKLRCAVAYGTAACLREGTCPPAMEDVAAIQAETVVFCR